MNIALVNHTFPPHSFAGSEKCVYLLARELIRRGHEVRVFFRVHLPDRPEYDRIDDEYDGIPTTAINNTYRHVDAFADIYHNPVIGARFGEWLGEFRPQVVHFHHLTNLSLSLVDEAQQRGCTTVMTLHDYWLLCQRGQLLQEDLSLCSGPSASKCRACLAPQLVRGRMAALGKRVARWMTPQPNAGFSLGRSVIDTPNRNFVQWTRFGNEPGGHDTLMMHPPASVCIPVETSGPVWFRSLVGMHPDTTGQSGAGVVFSIEANGERIYSLELNAKARNDDRGWHEVSLELPECQSITIRTQAQDGKGEFCSAGWYHPVVESDREFAQPIHRGRSWPSRIASVLSNFSRSAHEGIAHRQNWVRRVFDSVDHFVSPSQYLRDFFVEHGIDPQRISMLPNGFTPIEPPAPRQINRPVRFGYLGTWIPSKGLDLLMEAFRDVDPQEARLVVYGFFPGYDGYENYERQIRALAGPAVTFAGRYEAEAVHDLLAEMDVLVVPSIWVENSPMTIQEAFQAGVPVLTADAGGMAEQVRSGGGWTFAHRDADDLRRVLASLIQKPEAIVDMRSRIPTVPGIEEQTDKILSVYTLVQKREHHR